MTKLKHVMQAAADLTFPLNKLFFTLQEEQSLRFLKAWQSIHLCQPWITFPSPFRVAGVDGQLSPAFKAIRWKAFGGWKFDWGTTKLHARILRGKGVQKKKPNMFTVGSSTSATFVLPVRPGTGVALKKRVWTQYGRFPKSSMEQSCKWDTMATMKKVRVLHRKAWNQRIQIFYVEYDDQAEVREASSSRLDNSHWISFSLPFRRNKVYASWKLDKASILVNRGSHFQVHFVWQVWDGKLPPAF